MKPVIFMVIVSVAFITALATINELTRAQIEKNVSIQQAKELVYAFDIFPADFPASKLSPAMTTADIPWQKSELLAIRNAQIREVTIPVSPEIQAIIAGSFLDGQHTISIYEQITSANDVLAYGVQLMGKGLWGTIEGFGVISADLQTMQGIAFTKQSETPGLGARIMEEEYKYFFRNLDLTGFSAENPAMAPVIMVRKKAKTNVAESTNSVQAITGATQTSQGVLDMINHNLRVYLPILQQYKAQKI